MYDFYFGTKEDVLNDEPRFLLSVKRMIPKWANSIPDSEFLALHHVLKTLDPNRQDIVLAETGTGASTVCLIYHAIKHGGKLYSWDFNGEKASLIRTVCVETICNYFNANINSHWKCVNYNSTSEAAGLPILRYLEKGVDLFFHDSEHVLDVILAEIKAIEDLLVEGAYICMDDANYAFKHTNTAFINIVRTKLGLPKIPEIPGNSTKPFHVEVEEYLRAKWRDVRHIDDYYKQSFRDDIYFSYFNNELSVKASLKMENIESLAHRFDCWQVRGEKS